MIKLEKDNRFSGIPMLGYFFLYKIIIEIAYIVCIAPRYSYADLTLDANMINYWISNLLLGIIIFLNPKNKLRPSTYLVILLEIFLLIPTLSYYWLNNQSSLYMYMIVSCFGIISLMLRIPPIKLKIKDKTARVWLDIIFLIYILITLYLIIRRGGIDLRTLRFDLIYELRGENELGGMAGYLMNWTTKALCPFFFVYFIYYKNKLKVLVCVGLQVMMYLSFGNKAFLLSIGIIFMCMWVARRKKFIREFIIAMCGINIIAYILDVLNISSVLLSSIPYRFIFIPTQIQFQYYEFFKEREKLYFAEGVIGKLLSIESSYPQRASVMIGYYYSNNGLGSNANTGLFSDAYSNGGFIGMILIAIVFVLILYIVDSTTYNLKLYIVVGAFSYMIVSINDVALLTTLLTGGMLLTMGLLMLFNSSITPSNKSNIVYKRE